jgi:4-hydroxy-4-methyl-2-oxoglutarate aldolase
MIKDPPLLTVNRNICRPDKHLLERFADIPTAYVVDAMGGRGALDFEIEPLVGNGGPMSAFVGPALTCHCGPADNLALLAAALTAERGDVLVCGTDRFTGTCVAGDLLLGAARKQGVAGFVTDGLVRDVEGILEVGLPVFCRGKTPNSPTRNGPGTVGFPIVVGHVAVRSGDVIVADREGVVVVPQQLLSDVLDELEPIKTDEAAAESAMTRGEGIVAQIRKLLDSDRVRYVD